MSQAVSNAVRNRDFVVCGRFENDVDHVTLKDAILREDIRLLKLILQISPRGRFSNADIQVSLDEVVSKIRKVNVRTRMTEYLKSYQRFGERVATNARKAMLLIKNGTEQEALNFIEGLSLHDLQEEIYSSTLWEPHFPPFVTLLTCATKLNKPKIVETLLERGCDVDQSDNSRTCIGLNSRCALTIAIENDNYDMCKLLLKRGARVEGDGMCTRLVFPRAFRQKNQKILRLLVEGLQDPCTVLEEFANFRDFFVNGEDIMDIFSVELISYILHRSRISADTWLHLIRGRQDEKRLPRFFGNAERIGRRFILNLLLNYLPSAPEEMQAALRCLSKSRDVSNTDITNEGTDWLLKNAVKCPSLQSVCRFTIRQAVQPCTESNIQSLQLPIQIQEYLLEHPLKKCLSHYKNEGIRKIPRSEEMEKSYLYIDH